MSDTENAERDFEFEAFVSGYLRWIRHRLRKRVSVANAVLLDFDQLENDIQFEFAMRLQATNWQTLTRLEGFGMLWRIVDSRILTPSTLKNEQNGQDLSSTENGSIARVFHIAKQATICRMRSNWRTSLPMS